MTSMTVAARSLAAVALAGVMTTGLLLAQTPPPQSQPPAPATGRGAAPPQAGRQGGGGRVGGYTQYTRPLAPEDVIVRGKSLYGANCASCHAIDLRGTVDGKNPNLLRSGVALRDQKGELIGARLAKHTAPITLTPADTEAIAEYIHSVHATMGGQGSPPGRNPTNVTLNVLVGDVKNGETAFTAVCGACHSVTGNLKGIGSKFADPRALQNGWVSGSMSTFGGGGRGGGGPVPAVVTLADGSKLEGTLLREDDFLVTLMLPDGTRKSCAHQWRPRVESRIRRRDTSPPS